jgi:hypothetical protein
LAFSFSSRICLRNTYPSTSTSSDRIALTCPSPIAFRKLISTSRAVRDISSALDNRLYQVGVIVPRQPDTLVDGPRFQCPVRRRMQQRARIRLYFPQPCRPVHRFQDHRHAVVQIHHFAVRVHGDDRVATRNRPVLPPVLPTSRQTPLALLRLLAALLSLPLIECVGGHDAAPRLEGATEQAGSSDSLSAGVDRALGLGRFLRLVRQQSPLQQIQMTLAVSGLRRTTMADCVGATFQDGATLGSGLTVWNSRATASAGRSITAPVPLRVPEAGE